MLCLFPPRLFRERLSQLRARLEEVGAERAPEYTEPLGGLQRSLKIRIQVAGLWAVLCAGAVPGPPLSASAGAQGSLLPALPFPARPGSWLPIWDTQVPGQGGLPVSLPRCRDLQGLLSGRDPEQVRV